MLKYLGHNSVAILDGGWAAWAAGGLPTETAPTNAHLGRRFVAAPRTEILASTNYVAERLFTEVVIIDARPPGQYEGTTQSGLVTRPGQIPGAISLDNALFYDTAADRLKPIDELTKQLPPKLSVFGTQIIVYCNTGHWSSINWFVLHELLGFDNTRLYEGSIAAWSRDLALSLITGPDP